MFVGQCGHILDGFYFLPDRVLHGTCEGLRSMAGVRNSETFPSELLSIAASRGRSRVRQEAQGRAGGR